MKHELYVIIGSEVDRDGESIIGADYENRYPIIEFKCEEDDWEDTNQIAVQKGTEREFAIKGLKFVEEIVINVLSLINNHCWLKDIRDVD